jgi:GDPmannose 4,6-dehydratase
MLTALITGVTGQDGSYLAELLITKGYHVIGAVRDKQGAKKLLPAGLKNSVELVTWDMLDQHHMMKVLEQYHPEEIYNFAAYSSGAKMYDDPVAMGDLNGLAVARMLEAIRQVDFNMRFCHASSREVFGETLERPQDELTQTNPRSPYGAAKLYADSMIRIYRQIYNIYACSAILFNHESPRRGLEFVTRKITHEAAKIKLGLVNRLHLGNLDALRDWGYAEDYVRAMWLMLQQKSASDYVVATGESHSVRELCEIAFSHLGMDYRDFVYQDTSLYRSDEPLLQVGCASKAQNELGWSPMVTFNEMVKMMVDADLNLLKKTIGMNKDFS